MDVREALTAVIDGDNIDTSRDPQAVVALARTLADGLRDSGVDRLACWVGDDESVLAHAVAVELGVPVLRATEDLGLLTLEGPRRAGMRVVAVATRWGGRNSIDPLLGLLRNEGVEPVAFAALTAGADVGGRGFPVIIVDAA